MGGRLLAGKGKMSGHRPGSCCSGLRSGKGLSEMVVLNLGKGTAWILGQVGLNACPLQCWLLTSNGAGQKTM